MKKSNLNVIPLPEPKYIRAWEQPNRKHIILDDTHALMSQVSFNKLKDYSHSKISGVYIGKMWKKQRYAGIWALCWFGIEDEPGYLTNHYREILILE